MTSLSHLNSGVSPDFKYNVHSESIFDDERLFPVPRNDPAVIRYDSKNPHNVNLATIKALVVHLTSPEVIDYNFVYDFFLTYRLFINSERVLNLLITRFIWSLQYINSTDVTKAQLGKLVLLRTFVVLRHWLLNYFDDDFRNDGHLRNIFVTNFNQISTSRLVHKENQYEAKILCDLKSHWISLCNEHLETRVAVDDIHDLVSYQLADASPRKASIELDPSYRRSVMLSLYDTRARHKLPIPQKTSKQSPSIHKLLLQHKSSKGSVSGSSSFQRLAMANRGSVAEVTSKPNHQIMSYLNPKNSSLSLKKILPRKNKNVRQLEIANKPAKELEFKRLSYDSDKENDNNGFSVSGNVKMPSSKIEEILPPTPVKKMNIQMRTPKVSYDEKTLRNSPQSASSSGNSDVVSRKKSFKKLTDRWRRTFDRRSASVMVGEGDNIDELITNAINVIHENSGQVDSVDGEIEDEHQGLDARMDVLSARIIDELEYIIRFYLTESKENTMVNKSVEATGVAIDENEMMSKMSSKTDLITLDINNLSELNINKIDGIINNASMQNLDETNEEEDDDDNFLKPPENILVLEDEETKIPRESFQNPVEISWNDDVDLDNSNNQNSDELDLDLGDEEVAEEVNFTGFSEVMDSEITRNHGDESFPSRRLTHKKTSMFKHFQDAEEPPNVNNSSISTPSNLSEFNANVNDLSINQNSSPPLPITTPPPDDGKKHISFDEVNLASSRYSARPSSFSRSSHLSAKSYMSYDSELSLSNSEGDTFNKGNEILKKKAGFHNLRSILPEDGDDEMEVVEGMNSNAILTTELPFYGDESIKKEANNSVIFTPNEDGSNLKRFTIFNDSKMTKTSTRESGLSKEGEIMERNDSLNSKIQSGISKEGDILERNDSFNSKVQSGISKDGDKLNSSTFTQNSVVIPGISNAVLKELAAIPDESGVANDPIAWALLKLEGKQDSEKSTDEERIPETFNLGYGDDTDSILAAINNANTADILKNEYTDQFDEDQEIEKLDICVTPTRMNNKRHSVISKRFSSFNGDLYTSTPNGKHKTVLYNNVSPRTVLDNYVMSSNLLSIDKVMENRSHISFVLSYESGKLANHFTTIEKDMLLEIDWKELIELKWNKDVVPINSWLEIMVNDDRNRGVDLVIARFNLMVNWVISEILLTPHQTERRNLISRFIHIADNCYHLQNFSTLMQIILALTSEKVTKLKETWKNLSPGDILMLKNLEKIVSPLQNFLNLRFSINKIVPSKGCIPFVGLYLSDLTFNAERPIFTKASEDVIHDESETTIDSDNNELKLVNFARFRTSVAIVKSLSQCMEWSQLYDLAFEGELLSKCLYIKSLTEEEMNYCVENLVDA